jgi:hypothetical protein
LDKKYQIFISSTYDDLIEERTKVRDAILSMMHFPVGMELFGATDEESWQIITNTIDSSDYYVLIVGHRYGSVIEDEGISFTEKEFRYARDKGIPILAFVVSESVIPTVNKVDSEPSKKEKLVAFKQAVMTGRNIDQWSNPDELSQKVTAGLYKQITRTKRPGWIRGDAIDVEKSLAEILELNKRLHDLEDENKNLLLENRKLKEKAERKPFLTISMAVDEGFDDEEKEQSYYQHGEFIHIDEDNTVHLTVGRVYTNNIEAEYYPVSRSDFFGELRTHISDKEIHDYNEALPSEETLKKYIRQYMEFKRVQDFGVAVTVYINNLGTTKATDISATIEFPDEVRVYDVTKVEDMKAPEAPGKPEDLFQKAYMRAHRSEMAFMNAMGQIDTDIFQVRPSVHLSDLSRFTRQTGMDEFFLIEDNIVEIEDKSGIVHTKSDWYRGCYLVALQPGEYMAKVTMMCAEYENPEVAYIKFVCEE